jgi:N-acetylglutamate synthase-like GNAT family acetyltransferase
MIRQASKFDTVEIIDMLRDYRMATPWARLAECDNEFHVRRLLAQIFAGGGVIFLSEHQMQVTGMLIAIKNPNIWDPELLVMNELCYWVDPDHRGSTAGYRLLKTYVDHCEQLKQQGQIESYTISKMVNSPDLDYGRFGFEKLEEMWRH